MNQNIALLLCCLSVLAACGGGDGGSGGGNLISPGSSSSSSAASVGKFIYIPNNGANTITAYSINATTGALTAIPGAPFATGAGNFTSSLAAHPSGRFLYATNLGNTNIAASVSAFVVNNTTGALSLTSGSPYPVGLPVSFSYSIDTPMSHPDGKFLYIRKATELQIFGYAVDQTSGALTSLASSPLPYTTLPGRFNYSNKLYYAPLFSSSNAVGVYAVDSVTGVGSSQGSAPASQPVGIPAFDAANRYLYSASAARSIFGYSINATTGVLTALPGSPYAWPPAQGGTVPNSPPQVVVHASGKFVYVLDLNVGGSTLLGNSNITIYSIDQTTGALTAVGSPVSTGGSFAVGMQIYKNGQFLLVTNLSGSVAIFGINLTTGALTPAVGSPFSSPGPAPGIVMIDPSGKFAYLTDAVSNTITEFTIDATAGTITVGPNYPTGPVPSRVPFIVGLQ